MITYKQVDETYLEQYDKIPMQTNVSSYYKIEKINNGLDGFNLIETEISPYIKNFCEDENDLVINWAKEFDTSNWAFFMAFDSEVPVGGATIASRTKGINMLSKRNDLAVLWDIRVAETYKNQGIGKELFNMARNWSKNQGLIQMKIECQNTNVSACKFYHSLGAVLSVIDEYAYYNEPKYKHETMFIWFLEI